MAKKEKKQEIVINEEKIYSFLCYLISVIGVLIVLATKKERTSHNIYHAKQGTVLFILMVLVAIVQQIFAMIPVIGTIINVLLWLSVAILWIIGMLNSFSNELVPLPIIGDFAKSFKF